jgi:hypothetical protein
VGREDRKSSGARGDPEHKRPDARGSPKRRQTGDVDRTDRAAARDTGHSGYGSESVRPYLRAQLKMKELFGTPFGLVEEWDKRRSKKDKPGRK